MKSPLFWLLLVGVASTPVWAIECGDVLGPGGVYTLTADLVCEEDPGLALTLMSGAVLDLGGFTLQQISGTGVVVEGEGATIRHGVIEAGSLPGVGIVLRGEGRHIVEDLTTRGTESGIDVESDRNLIRRNTIHGDVGMYALQVAGHHNIVRLNTIQFNQASISGDKNTIIDNRSLQAFPGFTVSGNGNRLVRNTIGEESSDYEHYTAIVVTTGQRNLLWQNTALGEPSELFDAWGDCIHNLWIGNEADVSDPPCILEGPLAVSHR